MAVLDDSLTQSPIEQMHTRHLNTSTNHRETQMREHSINGIHLKHFQINFNSSNCSLQVHELWSKCTHSSNFQPGWLFLPFIFCLFLFRSLIRSKFLFPCSRCISIHLISVCSFFLSSSSSCSSPSSETYHINSMNTSAKHSFSLILK